MRCYIVKTSMIYNVIDITKADQQELIELWEKSVLSYRHNYTIISVIDN